jgi:hypothetical protein
VAASGYAIAGIIRRAQSPSAAFCLYRLKLSRFSFRRYEHCLVRRSAVEECRVSCVVALLSPADDYSRAHVSRRRSPSLP